MSVRVTRDVTSVTVNGTLYNLGPGTVYYSASQGVSTSSSDGSLASGASAALDGTQWLVSDSTAYVNAVASPVVGGSGSGAPEVAGRAWAPSTAYKAGDVVTNAGTLYRANADFTSGASFNAANWTAVAALPSGGPGVLSRAVADGAATWAPQASDVILFAPDPSGDTTGVTDTAALQALLDQCYAGGGGTVQLQAAGPSAPYYVTQLKMRTFVELVGTSRWGSVLRAPMGQASGKHMIVLNDDLTWGFAIRRLTLDGQNGKGPAYPGGVSTPAQPNAFKGMFFDITTSNNHFAPYDADSASVVADVSVVQMPDIGIEVNRAMSEMRFRGVYVLSCRWVGWNIFYADCFFSDCTAGACGGIGFRVGGSVNQLTNCKGFWNGWNGSSVFGTVPADFFIEGKGNSLENCFSQDSYASGFSIKGVEHRVCGTVAGGNAENVRLDAPVDCHIDITSNTRINNLTPDHILNHVGGATGCTVILDGAASETGTLVTGASLVGNDVTIKRQKATQSVAYAASITPDPYAGGKILVGTLTGGITIANPSQGHVGCELTFTLTQDATGGRSVTFGAAYQTQGAIPTTPSTTTIVTFVYDGTVWQEKSRNGGGSAAATPTTPAIFAESGNYFAPAGLAVTSGHVAVDNLLCAFPIVVGRNTTISELGANVATAGGASSVIRLGIYADNGNFYPGALVADAGTVSTSTTGRKAITGLSVALTAGRVYWIVGVLQSGATALPVMTRAAVGQMYSGYMGDNEGNAGWLFGGSAAASVFGFSQASVTGALPANFTTTRTQIGNKDTSPVLLVARAA